MSKGRQAPSATGTTVHPPERTSTVYFRQVPEVSVHDLAAAGSDALVIDVREPDEFVEGHVPWAVHIPMARVPEQLGEIPDDQPVYVICAVGGRSARVAEYLITNGRNAVNVAGGTQDWISSGYPVDTAVTAS